MKSIEHIESLGSKGNNLARFNFPKDIYRVTSGEGGESILIDGGSVVGIYDCGMAYCHDGVIKNIETLLQTLGHENLDKVILSHSHYDHIGALPYILKRWPNAEVVGGAKLKQVFSSDRAKATMKRLGEAARDKYLPQEMHNMEIDVEGMRVDTIVEDGDYIDLGRYSLKAIYTPGHTDCSFSYLMKGEDTPSIIFTSESMGVLEDENFMHTSVLKNFDDTINSAMKCKNENADIVICSHYGVVPESIKVKYFDMYVEFATIEKEFILDLFDKGYSFDGIYEEYEKKYWNQSRVGAQPIEAFKENAGYTIRLIVRTFRNTEI